MRTGALALLMLIAACGQDGPAPTEAGAGNAPGMAASGDQQATAATLTLAATGPGPGDCSARWDNRPATPQQVLERSGTIVERAIETAGGISNLTGESLPAIAVVAPAGLAFACADTYLGAIRRAGVPMVLLTVEGEPDAALADFALSDIGAPPPTVVLAVGRGGRMTWNNEALGLDAMPERLRQLGGGTPLAVEAPPGELELRPAREATFGQVHAALRAIRAGRFRAALLLPSVEPTRPPAPAPVAAPPPPPAVVPRPEASNEALPRP
jgi:hypothetical protein